RQQLARRPRVEALLHGVDLDAGRTEEAMSQRLDLRHADVLLAVELRRDVVLLDAIEIDGPKAAHALADEAVGEVRAHRAGAEQAEAHVCEAAHGLGASQDLLVVELAGHRGHSSGTRSSSSPTSCSSPN